MKFKLILLSVLLALAPARATWSGVDITWPASAGGKVAGDFFRMMKEGSDEAIRAFETTYRTQEALLKTPIEERVKRTRGLREQFGGLTATAVARSSKAQVVISATTGNGDAIEVEFNMDANEPDKLESIGIASQGPPPDAPSRPMTDASRAELVDAVARAVNDVYVFPEIGQRMAARIRAALKAGDYGSISREAAMATRLTQDLRSVNNDRHLGVRFQPEDPGAGPVSFVPQGDQAARTNYAFRKVEILDGNIGYLRLDLFLNEPEATKTADAAMAFLKHADAIVIDLRHNGGGDPEMIRHLTSYFFEARTHLNSMADRSGKIVAEFWTGDVPGAKFRAGLPLYVLTSSSSFSGAEEFAYNLKSLKRATIVGETTGGGAHPVRPIRINDRFVVGVPFQRAINPITKTNWEGVGVEPDVNVPAEGALDKALELIRAATRR